MALLKTIVRICPTLAALACFGQATAPEYQIKAAYLYNFAKFVVWPETAHQGGPVTICVFGKDPFGSVLAETIAGRQVSGRPVDARNLGVDGDPHGCHVVFFGAASPERLASGLRRAEKAGALTVGESRAFEDREGMIRFIEEGGRVRFEVNLDPVRRAGIQLSSQLLRVARAVRGRSPAVP